MLIPQNKIKKVVGVSKYMRKPSRYDADGDGVINKIDCQPHNQNKQGPLLKATGRELKERIKGVPKGFIERARQARIVRGIKSKELFKQRKEQAIVEATQKAKAERELRIKGFKARKSGKKGFVQTLQAAGRRLPKSKTRSGSSILDDLGKML